MKTIRKIRFSVKNNAAEDVEELIEDYARYVAHYAKKHDEVWTWRTYQPIDSTTELISIIAHQDGDAETRHMDADGTQQFSKTLYAHVTQSEQPAWKLDASSDA